MEVAEKEDVKQTTGAITSLSNNELSKSFNDLNTSVDVEDKEVETPADDKEGKEDVKPKSEGKEPSQEEEKVQIPKSELEKLNRQIAEKEALVKRQADEVGASRKRVADAEEKLKIAEEKLNEVYLQDGVSNAKAIKEFNQAEADLERTKFEHRCTDTKNIVIADDNAFESKKEAMLELLKEDGVSPETLKAFSENPYQYAPTELLFLANRADLKAELNALKAQMSNTKKSTEETLEKIEKGTHRDRMTAGSSSLNSTGPKSFNPKAMSSDALKAALKGD